MGIKSTRFLGENYGREEKDYSVSSHCEEL